MPTIDDRCIWNKIMNDPDSTTAKDVTHEAHPLYKCKECPTAYDIVNDCKNYRSLTEFRVRRYYEVMEELAVIKSVVRSELLKDDVKILRNRYEGKN